MSWDQEAREAMRQRHGCVKTRDEHTSTLNVADVYYCSRHMVGWLRDVDACAHVDAAVDALAPVVAREVARAKAEALREVRDAWQQGEWTVLTPKLPTPETRIGAAQCVTEWLSDRVDTEAGGS